MIKLKPTRIPIFRFLDMSFSSIALKEIFKETMIIRLHASNMNLQTVDKLIFKNLQHLDLSWNSLAIIDMDIFEQLINLRVLILAHNPITNFVNVDSFKCNYLHTLDLSFSSFDEFTEEFVVTDCDTLGTLNLSYSSVTSIGKNALDSMMHTIILDMVGTPVMTYPDDVLKKLDQLEFVYTENYRLCCPVLLPDAFTDLNNCQAKEDLVASCDDLLKSNIYRVFLLIIALLSVLGNVVSFLTRISYLNKSKMSSFGVFVSNLNIADFCMGVYLLIIFAADYSYRGLYVLRDIKWKTSVFT